MKLLIFKGKCPTCPKTVFHVGEPGLPRKVEYFEVLETKMLVLVATPEIDGVKRIALGPCKREEPFCREDEEPVIYFAHVRHGCAPLPLMPGTQVDTSTATMPTNVGQAVSIVPTPIVTPLPQEEAAPK